MSAPFTCGLCGDALPIGLIKRAVWRRQEGRNEFFDLDGRVVHRCQDEYLKDVRFIPLDKLGERE